MPPRNELTGHRFERLVVLMPEESRNGAWYWLCVCDCGAVKVVKGAELTNGRIKSCGCLRADMAPSLNLIRENYSGDSKNKNSPYSTWRAMRRRCYEITHKDYSRYGARGIDICAEWSDYKVFRDWAYSHGWEVGLTIDRIDPSLGYFPNNCRWITREENSRRAR